MFRTTFLAAAGIALASGAAAEADIYPYPTSKNFCPAGLQPIQLGGVICCGTPNRSVTYSSVMAHPARQPTVHRPGPPAAIPLGKGMDMRGDGS